MMIEHYISALSFVLFIGSMTLFVFIMAHVGFTFLPNQVEFQGTKKVQIVDNVATITNDGTFINLNSHLDANFENGDEIDIVKYKRRWLLHTYYEKPIELSIKSRVVQATPKIVSPTGSPLGSPE